MCASLSDRWTSTTRAGPPGTRFRTVHHFAEVDSTNRYLLDAARSGAPAPLVAVAEHQTAGRGRLGRRWEAPAGANLLVSVLLRPGLGPGELHLCTAAAALAAQSAVAAVGVPAEVKWPNDLLVAGRKLAGILAEAAEVGGEWAVVVGLGLNVGWPPPSDAAGPPVPAELADTATSLWRETGHELAPGALLEGFLVALERPVGDLETPEGRRRLADDYRSACATLGRPVAIDLPDGRTLTGTAVDLTAAGQLVVEADGRRTVVDAGDLRSARHR